MAKTRYFFNMIDHYIKIIVFLPQPNFNYIPMNGLHIYTMMLLFIEPDSTMDPASINAMKCGFMHHGQVAGQYCQASHCNHSECIRHLRYKQQTEASDLSKRSTSDQKFWSVFGASDPDSMKTSDAILECMMKSIWNLFGVFRSSQFHPNISKLRRGLSGSNPPSKLDRFWRYSDIYGGFHKRGYPNSWMVYKGKSH